jgi:hypothetical protein
MSKTEWIAASGGFLFLYWMNSPISDLVLDICTRMCQVFEAVRLHYSLVSEQ